MRRLVAIMVWLAYLVGHNPLGHWFYETSGSLELWLDERA